MAIAEWTQPFSGEIQFHIEKENHFCIAELMNTNTFWWMISIYSSSWRVKLEWKREITQDWWSVKKVIFSRFISLKGIHLNN